METEKLSDGRRPNIVEMVCFIESLAESETPLEITELSRGSIFFNMLAITENPRSNVDFLVETMSSETPPPLLLLLIQPTTTEVEETEEWQREKA